MSAIRLPCILIIIICDYLLVVGCFSVRLELQPLLHFKGCKYA